MEDIQNLSGDCENLNVTLKKFFAYLTAYFTSVCPAKMEQNRLLSVQYP